MQIGGYEIYNNFSLNQLERAMKLYAPKSVKRSKKAKQLTTNQEDFE